MGLFEGIDEFVNSFNETRKCLNDIIGRDTRSNSQRAFDRNRDFINSVAKMNAMSYNTGRDPYGRSVKDIEDFERKIDRGLVPKYITDVK